ncbi:MAG: DUF5069 domain-containing protein [Candidatus Poribacteria bacterium]|nr:DUF5069 domain-containing protein [Candidatus Poribacteria bacterium]
MDLTRQPPRRPSNLGVAGIVGAARMTDKARAHNEETLGDFVYGDHSGLDRRILAFLGISADDFAEAADEYDDVALSTWMLEKGKKTDEEIVAFNQTELDRLPTDKKHQQLLKERLAKFAPDRTDIKTVLQSIELDDWGCFWQVDLIERPPRSARARDVAGICGVARMADKARAERAGKIGDYKYGDISGQDVRILEFLDISADDFQEAAVNNPNDIEIGEWVQANCDKSHEEIDAFNHAMVNRGPDETTRERFEARCQEVDPTRTDITTWVALQDLDDQLSFGIVDLNRRAPRSPNNIDVYGTVQLARLIDKGRAFIGNTLGSYFYGEESGIDRMMLGFLGVSPADFTEALKTLSTDAEVEAWLKEKYPKSEADIKAFNEKMTQMGPETERHKAMMAKMLKKLGVDPSEINTWFAMMDLDDEKTFAL